MAILMSTELKNEMLAGVNLINALDFGVIRIYSGQQPASADLSPTGTLLASVTSNGLAWSQGESLAGLRLNIIPSIALLVKPQTPWVLAATTTGTAGWWRFRSGGEAALRMDGTVGGPDSDLFIGNQQLTAGEQRFIDGFQIGFFW